MTMPDPKAMDTAREAWIASDVATRFFSDVEEHALQAAITAYISTITPAEVGGLVDAQTEARAIAWEVRGAQLHRVFLDETEARELAGRFNGAVIPLVRATALAAKDAELAAVKVSNNKWLAKWERAEAQLAEARKALEPFARAADNFDGFKIANDEEWFAYGGVQSAAGSKGAIAVADLRAARRAREAQGGE